MERESIRKMEHPVDKNNSDNTTGITVIRVIRVPHMTIIIIAK